MVREYGPLVVGLTGGIGSGKSSVGKLFADYGATVIDADAVAHAISQSGQAGAIAVANGFGAATLDSNGAIDRAALRERVFADPGARKKLESLLHPLIRASMAQALANAPRDRYVIWMVPLLIESGRAREVCHRIAVVDCSETQQIARVQTRSALTKAAVSAIMATQVTRSDRLAHADDVIDNSTDLVAMQSQVCRLHDFYARLHAARDA